MGRWVWCFVLMGLGKALEGMERKATIVACVELTNARLMAEEGKVEKMVQASGMSKEKVMTKVMIGMIKACADTIPPNAVDSMMRADDLDPLLFDNMQYVPFLPSDYSREDSVQLTPDEEGVVREVQAMVKESEELQGKPLPQQAIPQSVSTQVQAVYLLLVFGGVAAVIVCGIQRMKKAPRGRKKKGE